MEIMNRAFIKILKAVYHLLPISIQRILWHIFFTGFTGKKFAYRNDPNVFRKIYENNMWNSDESCSGSGSEIATTVRIRKALPDLWKKYNIKTFLDVPCGDYNWMKEVDKKDVVYIGGDIVEEIIIKNNHNYKTDTVSFQVIDITKDNLPKVDMIFCKDCLQHLSYNNVFKALLNFKRSNSKYLLTSSYPLTWYNWDISDGDYRPLNLRKRPFHLPKPIEAILEDSKGKQVEADKYMYLYKLDDIEIKLCKNRKHHITQFPHAYTSLGGVD
jgi:hypothetical protein